MWGRRTTRSRAPGGTDSTSFNARRTAGHRPQQDPIEYGTYTWHTNLDTYERIIEDGREEVGDPIAAAVYHLAMRDEMLPRFSREECRRRRQCRQGRRPNSAAAKRARTTAKRSDRWQSNVQDRIPGTR